jgi:anti-sigma-K factor RskA
VLVVKLDNPEDRSVAAGEYVLGTLGDAERSDFEAALARDPASQAEVYAWQDRLLPLIDRIAPDVAPPADWARIEVRLAPRGAANLPAAPDAPARAAANESVYLAVLQAPADNSTGWVVEVTAGQRVRLVPVADSAPVPPGRALQFWTKAEGAAGPTSLGLVAPGRVTELPASMLPALGVRQLFELTLEPEAGSPVGRPTGPILFVGRTVRL